jgi:hypothetical protein
VHCIVVESGASSLTPASDGFDETIVVTQTTGESSAVFARRLMARIAGVERRRRHFESLTLLTGDRHDWASIAARRLIVRRLAAHARASGGSCELLLKASPNSGPETRAELLEVLEEVLSTLNGESVPVRLVFGPGMPPEPARRSDVPRAATKLRQPQAQPRVCHGRSR